MGDDMNKTIDYVSLGQKIAYYRKIAGLTQAGLAEIIGVTDGYISKIERGVKTLSLSRFLQIADVIDADIFTLLSISEKSSDIISNEIMYRIQSFDDEGRKDILDYIKYKQFHSPHKSKETQK